MKAAGKPYPGGTHWAYGSKQLPAQTKEFAMMGWYGNGWSGGGMIVMGLIWVVLIAGAVWAVLSLSRRSGGSASAAPESARQILDRRFASGEMDSAQYADARRALDGRSVDFRK